MFILSAIQSSLPIEELSMKQEVVLLIIGGLIAIISSIATLIVTNMMDRHGKLKIYKKIVYSKAQTGMSWGFIDGAEGVTFQIPLWIEIHNISNLVQVVRNLNAWLYKKKKKLCPMVQVNQIGDVVLANGGAYSFVIEPRSIKKFDCYYMIKRKDLPKNETFDEVRLAYYDFNDRLRIFHLKYIESSECWNVKAEEADKDWTLLKG